MEYSGACGKLIHEKNLNSQIAWNCLFIDLNPECSYKRNRLVFLNLLLKKDLKKGIMKKMKPLCGSVLYFCSMVMLWPP
jgi:hypothetical protein